MEPMLFPNGGEMRSRISARQVLDGFGLALQIFGSQYAKDFRALAYNPSKTVLPNPRNCVYPIVFAEFMPTFENRPSTSNLAY